LRARNEEVDGLAVDVLAELRDPGGARAQHGVGAGRAVTADHLYRLRAADLAIDLPQQIEQVGVHVGFFFLTPIAHEPVELFQRGLVVVAVALVGNGDVFAGVDVMEGEGAGVAFGNGVLQGVIGGEQKQGSRAQPRANAQQGRDEGELARRTNRHC
jgi:hypothetical protein